MIALMSHENEANSKFLANLARIELTSEEEVTLSKNLEKIMNYIHQIDEVDVEGVLPCAHVLETVHNVMDEDEPEACISTKDFLKNAPESVGGMVKVPTVIEESP